MGTTYICEISLLKFWNFSLAMNGNRVTDNNLIKQLRYASHKLLVIMKKIADKTENQTLHWLTKNYDVINCYISKYC